MKKTFVTPQVELISMDQTDVIATSGNTVLGNKGEGMARILDCSSYFS